MNGLSRQPFTVVRAPALNIGKITALLRRGFHDEPVQQWLFPRSMCRTVLNGLWFRELAAAGLREGTIWCLGDYSAGAIWFQPDPDGQTVRKQKLLDLCLAINPRAKRSKQELDRALAMRRPTTPHWYLAAVATAFSLRGQGRGRSVLLPALGICDETGRQAYLETATPNSLRFYESLGFRICDSFRLPNGPQIWCLERLPRRGV